MKKKTDIKTMTSQIITDGMLKSFLSYMPNPDDIISGTFESYATYRQMRADSRIKSLLNKIKTSALIFPYTFEQPDSCPDDVFKFVSNLEIFKNMYKKQKRMLTALDYGFSISEVVWKNPLKNNGKWIPDNIITRKPERFVFDSQWNLYWNEIGEKQKLDHNYKFLQFQHEPDDENPYGTSVLRCVYWAYMFKKAGYEFWLQATEKFSVKSIIALFQSDGDETSIRQRALAIADMLQNISSGSAAAVSNVDSIQQVDMAGSLEQFNKLVEACDLQICYGLTGQSVATSKTDGGSLALGEVQADMLYDDCKGIALELQGVLQKLVNWIVELNYGDAKLAPQIVFDVEQKATFEQIMQAIDRGIPVSKNALYHNYKLPEPDDAEDAFVKESNTMALSDSFGAESVKKNFTFF